MSQNLRNFKYLEYINLKGQLNDANIKAMLYRVGNSGLWSKLPQEYIEKYSDILKKIANYFNNPDNASNLPAWCFISSIYLNKVLGIKYKHASSILDGIYVYTKLNNLHLFDNQEIDVSNYWIHDISSTDIIKLKPGKCKLNFGYTHNLPMEDIIEYFEEIEIRIYRSRFEWHVSSIFTKLMKNKSKKVSDFLDRLREVRAQFKRNTKMGTVLQSKDGKLKIEIRSMR
jgi:hypothetical protein